jgi:uncharacterized membrane protein YgdD (TMEM256/DUF423 family)
LSPDRLSQFETGVRYHLWHALALFAVIFVWSIRPFGWTSYSPLLASRPYQLWPVLAGWFFIAGVILFSGSLYALALTGNRRWAAATPFGGLAFLLGWLALLIAIFTV